MTGGMSLMGIALGRLFWMAVGALLAWLLLRRKPNAPSPTQSDEAVPPTLSDALSRNVFDHVQALPR